MSDITVILNGYRRPRNLHIQIQHLLNQSIKPKEIWLWINYHQDWDDRVLTNLTDIKICRSNHNWKYLGRFALASLAQTEYVALFDDDTIPGEKWLENCLNTIESTENSVIGGIGLVHKSQTSYMDHIRYGWANGNSSIERADLIGHAWFIKWEHLNYLWRERPVTHETAEDMHLCYSFQKYGNISPIVPVQNTKSLSSSLYGYELGVDHTTPSTTNHKDFFAIRDFCLQEYIKRGWKLINF